MTTAATTVQTAAGNRIGVLIVPAMPGEEVDAGAADLQALCESLVAAGFHVRSPAPSEFAVAEGTRRETEWFHWLKVCERSLDELQAECDVVVCGGVGTGIIPSLLLAAGHSKRVHGTLLIAPEICPGNWLASLADGRWLKRLGGGLASVFRRGAGNKETTASAGTAAVVSKGAATARRVLAAALRCRIENVTQPTLIIHRRGAECNALSSTWFLQRCMGGRVDAVVLDGVAASAGGGRHRHMVVERSRAFLTQLAAQHRTANPAARSAA